MSELAEKVPDVASLQDALDATGYLADEALGTALFLAARMGQPILLEGEPPSQINLPAGCRFNPRCRIAVPQCRQAEPALLGEAAHVTACHLAHERPA